MCVYICIYDMQRMFKIVHTKLYNTHISILIIYDAFNVKNFHDIFVFKMVISQGLGYSSVTEPLPRMC